MNSIRKKIQYYLSSFFFKLYKITKGSLEEHFTEKALNYVAEHELPHGCDYSPYRHQFSHYFKKWGFEF